MSGLASHDRLLRADDVRRYRAVGYAALAVALLPVGSGARGPVWLWDALPSVDWDARLPLLAPPLLAAWLLALPALGRWFTRLGLGLAALVGLAAAALAFAGPGLTSYETFGEGVFAFVAHHPLWALVAFGLVAAGGDVEVAAGARYGWSPAWVRALLAGGGALLLGLYALPFRGTSFGGAVADAVASVLGGGPHPGGLAAALGVLLQTLFAAVPLGLGLWALGLALASAGRARPGGGAMLAAATRFGLAGLGAVLAYRGVAGGLPFGALGAFLRGALLFVVAVATLSYALGAVASHLLLDPLPPPGEPSPLARDCLLRGAVRAARGRATGAATPLGGTLVPPGLHPLTRWLLHRRLEELRTEPWRDAGEASSLDPLEALAARLDPQGDAPTVPPRRVAWVTRPAGGWLALALALALGGGVAALRLHHPTPDLAWTLGPATPQADALLGRLLPGLVLDLSHKNLRLADEAPAAEAAVEVRSRRAEVLDAARAVDPTLAVEVGRLLDRIDRGATQLDASGRLFVRALVPVNRRLRALGLPYWLDGYSLRRSVGDGATVRVFFLASHRVLRVDQVREGAGGRELGAIFVRRLDDLPVAGVYLGFVMPDEPFAVVDLDRIDEEARRWAKVQGGGARCGLARSLGVGAGGDGAVSLYAEQADRACGRVLSRASREARARARREGGASLRWLAALLWPSSLPSADRPQTVLAGALARLTRRHELQHQADGDDLRVPARVYALARGRPEAWARRAAAELSAHLCELGTADPLEQALGLGNLGGFLLRGEPARTSPYHVAAAVVFEALRGPAASARAREAAEHAARHGAPGEASTRWPSVVAAVWADVDAAPDAWRAWLAPIVRATHEELFGVPCARLPEAAEGARGPEGGRRGSGAAER